MAVYSYSRVSTTKQADEGQSLSAQERSVAGYVMMHGLTVTQAFVERGVSGSVPLRDRPQGRAMLAALKPDDVVITPKLDRMFRSARDALDVLDDLKARNISLHMIDLGGDVISNGISKLVFTILSAVAEAERDRIRERISTVKADQKTRGHYLGGIVPYGYKLVNRYLEPVPEQQAIISEVLTLRAQGKPLRAIQAAVGDKLSLAALSRICKDAVSPDLLTADKGDARTAA